VYRAFFQNLTPRLREEIQRDLPYLYERIEGFERQVFNRSFSKLLKELRSDHRVNYPSPTRELSSAFFDMLRGLVHTQEEKAVFILQSFFKGISAKKDKDKSGGKGKGKSTKSGKKKK
ncbi:MAG: hypothetical protein AAF570_22990, partial [Bacteroidota bacterium]